MIAVTALTERIQSALGDKVGSLTAAKGELTLVIAASDLIAAMTEIRDRPELRFEQLIDLCGVDYAGYGRVAWSGTPESEGWAGVPLSSVAPESDASPPLGREAGFLSPEAKETKEQASSRYAVVYHLLSLSHNARLRVRVFAPDDEMPLVESVTSIWAAADWFEREAFDLFGIVFNGHPDLRRILTDYGFIGHPFRKDFPVSGNVEMRYDPAQQRVIYQPVTIEPREIVPRIVREENYAAGVSLRKG